MGKSIKSQLRLDLFCRNTCLTKVYDQSDGMGHLSSFSKTWHSPGLSHSRWVCPHCPEWVLSSSTFQAATHLSYLFSTGQSTLPPSPLGILKVMDHGRTIVTLQGSQIAQMSTLKSCSSIMPVNEECFQLVLIPVDSMTNQFPLRIKRLESKKRLLQATLKNHRRRPGGKSDDEF